MSIMGNFVISSSNLNNNYEYSNSDIVVIGSYSINKQTNTLQSVDGRAYAANEQGEQGDYIGNFNGYNHDVSMQYSISEMPLRDSAKVLAAINEIEQNILSENE